MGYATEFPGFPAADIPAFVLGAGWTDRSFRSDAAPIFVHEISGLTLRVNVADPAARPDEMGDRFIVERMTSDPVLGWTWGADMCVTSYAGDELSEALAVLIGEAFAIRLREYLGADRFAAMQRANIGNGSGPICASHDFCDSNVFMAEAFEMVTGREPLASFEADEQHLEAQCNADSDLWSAAWRYAQPLRLTAAF